MKMSGVAGDRKADDDWLPMSRVAELRGVSVQAVSKRIAGFMARGMIETRRVGKERLVHVPTYDALAAATHDPAQDLRLRHIKAAAPAGVENDPPAAFGQSSRSAYDEASAREKNARAELAELRLAEERGDLMRRRDIAPAVEKIAVAIRQRIETLRAISGRLYAAAMGGGEEAVMLLLGEEISRTQEALRDDLMELKSRAEEDESEPGA